VYDAKQQEFLREEAQRLQRLLDAAMGQISKMQEAARSDHHLILVLRERINDLTREVQALKKEV
jgi:predicted  nucleic acid-binding Zn-ribbon protein